VSNLFYFSHLATSDFADCKKISSDFAWAPARGSCQKSDFTIFNVLTNLRPNGLGPKILCLPCLKITSYGHLIADSWRWKPTNPDLKAVAVDGGMDIAKRFYVFNHPF
jgi:hypothetical protein